MQFFISSLTGTTSNSKAKKDSARPGISFFICYRKNSGTNKMIVFQHLHDAGLDANVTEIKTKGDSQTSMLQSLKLVVKVSD